METLMEKIEFEGEKFKLYNLESIRGVSIKWGKKRSTSYFKKGEKPF